VDLGMSSSLPRLLVAFRRHIAQKIQCQLSSWVSAPPTKGPIATPRPPDAAPDSD
jgi:hypothetical protein